MNRGFTPVRDKKLLIRMMKSKRMSWARHVACMRRRGIHIKFFVRNPEVRRPLGRPRYRWDDNIITYLGVCDYRRDWIY
jgi:hypothetical protein